MGSPQLPREVTCTRSSATLCHTVPHRVTPCHTVPRHAAWGAAGSPCCPPPGAECCKRGERVTSQLSSSLSACWVVFKLSPPFLARWPSPPMTPRGGNHWLEFPKTRGAALPQPGSGAHAPSWACSRPLLFIPLWLALAIGPPAPQRAAESREVASG